MSAKLDEHVRVYDAAIDWSDDAGTPPEWMDDRDPSKLRIKVGRAPVRFRCVRLSRDAYDWVNESHTEEGRLRRAFRAGVREVTLPEGTWRPSGVDERGYIAMTEDECARFAFADSEEIGALVYTRSKLPFDCEAAFTRRPFSLLVLGAQIRRSQRAAQSQAQPAPTASAPEAAPPV